MGRLVSQGQLEGKRTCGRSPMLWTDIIKSATHTTHGPIDPYPTIYYIHMDLIRYKRS